jgi:hypothetical protein
MKIIDSAAQAAWVAVFLAFAFLVVRPDKRWLAYAAWGLAGAVALFTAGVIVSSSFGFTRDVDRAVLLLDKDAAKRFSALCKTRISPNGVGGNVKTRTLNNEFVIADLTSGDGATICTIDVPRTDLLGFQETHN